MINTQTLTEEYQAELHLMNIKRILYNKYALIISFVWYKYHVYWTIVYLKSFVTVSMCVSVAKKIDELQEILKKKDEDMKRMEDRYKRYVEKARTVRSHTHTHSLVTYGLIAHKHLMCLCFR